MDEKMKGSKSAVSIMIEKLNELSGWYRVGLVLSLFWLVVSTTIYFSNVGSSTNAVTWMPLWRQVFIFSDSLPLFNHDCIDTGNATIINGNLDIGIYCTNELSVSGLGSFVLYPIALLWILGMSSAWVFKGFRVQKS